MYEYYSIHVLFVSFYFLFSALSACLTVGFATEKHSFRGRATVGVNVSASWRKCFCHLTKGLRAVGVTRCSSRFAL